MWEFMYFERGTVVSSFGEDIIDEPPPTPIKTTKTNYSKIVWILTVLIDLTRQNFDWLL